MTFRSKVDLWLAAVLCASALTVLLSAVMTIRSGAGWGLSALLIVVGVGLPLWVLLATRYTITAQALQIQSGPFHWTVALSSISSMRPTRSVLSSPALSLDRLRIEYEMGRKAVLISPLDQQAFMRAIESARAHQGQ